MVKIKGLSRIFTGDLFVLNDLLGPSDGICERHKFAKCGSSKLLRSWTSAKFLPI
ncbi:hypothetical protein T12_1891 [Trichinella patagoniensis]|uniref:Uncharacterized protein n=1 Tax=Trichinella patagoniensis TaxID=990121 RepID=A0A0V0Y5A0_9BILA|nr:hypothetical protein T12_1891 [Trichinella patagoniensis]